MNEINLAGMHTVRSTGGLAYSQAASAPRTSPSVNLEPEQLDQVNIGVELTYSDASESVSLTSEDKATDPLTNDSFKSTSTSAKHGLTDSEFNGFLIADASSATVSGSNQASELSVSSLGTIALIDDLSHPDDIEMQTSAAQAAAAVGDSSTNQINGLGMFANGPSTMNFGIYNTDGLRII
ncbi:MAG: hypothetical protein ACI376_08080 [Candidatus Bruticola sp.]